MKGNLKMCEHTQAKCPPVCVCLICSSWTRTTLVQQGEKPETCLQEWHDRCVHSDAEGNIGTEVSRTQSETFSNDVTIVWRGKTTTDVSNKSWKFWMLEVVLSQSRRTGTNSKHQLSICTLRHWAVMTADRSAVDRVTFTSNTLYTPTSLSTPQKCDQLWQVCLSHDIWNSSPKSWCIHMHTHTYVHIYINT